MPRSPPPGRSPPRIPPAATIPRARQRLAAPGRSATSRPPAPDNRGPRSRGAPRRRPQAPGPPTPPACGRRLGTGRRREEHQLDGVHPRHAQYTEVHQRTCCRRPPRCPVACHSGHGLDGWQHQRPGGQAQQHRHEKRLLVVVHLVDQDRRVLRVARCQEACGESGDRSEHQWRHGEHAVRAVRRKRSGVVPGYLLRVGMPRRAPRLGDARSPHPPGTSSGRGRHRRSPTP